MRYSEDGLCYHCFKPVKLGKYCSVDCAVQGGHPNPLRRGDVFRTMRISDPKQCPQCSLVSSFAMVGGLEVHMREYCVEEK